MQHLNHNSDLSLLEFAELKSYPKGFNLLTEGTVSKYIYQIQTGICRLFYYDNDKEVTSWFAFDGEIITSTSFISRRPSIETLQCLEDCTVLQISYEVLQDIFLKHPPLERFARLNQEQIIIQLEERLRGLQFKTAKERYDHLLLRFPSIMLRVPHYYVASYLGITPETLSRIRALK
jgi:CRP-like cAMP-binding protein